MRGFALPSSAGLCGAAVRTRSERGAPACPRSGAAPVGVRSPRDLWRCRVAAVEAETCLRPSNAQRSLLLRTLTRTAPLPSVRRCDKPQWRCAAEHVPEWIQFEKEAAKGISSTEGLRDLCHSRTSRRSGLVQPRGEVCGKGAVVKLRFGAVFIFGKNWGGLLHKRVCLLLTSQLAV